MTGAFINFLFFLLLMKCAPFLHEHKTTQERYKETLVQDAAEWCRRWQIIIKYSHADECLLLKKCIALQNANFSAKNTYFPALKFMIADGRMRRRGRAESRYAYTVLKRGRVRMMIIEIKSPFSISCDLFQNHMIYIFDMVLSKHCFLLTFLFEACFLIKSWTVAQIEQLKPRYPDV